MGDGIHSANAYRFPSLFTVIVLIQLFISVIHAAPTQTIGRTKRDSVRHSFRRVLTKPTEVYVTLQNYGNRKFLQILGEDRGVNINGNEHSIFARIRMLLYKSKDETDKDLYVQLQGNETKAYMCFSSRGKLVSKYGNSRKWRSVFKLQYKGGIFYELQSAANPDWIVNFRRKKGTPYHYNKSRRKIGRKRKTVQFIIKEIKDSTEKSPPSSPLGRFDNVHNDIVKGKVPLFITNEKGHNIRHAGQKRGHRSRPTRESVIYNDLKRTQSLGKT